MSELFQANTDSLYQYFIAIDRIPYCYFKQQHYNFPETFYPHGDGHLQGWSDDFWAMTKTEWGTFSQSFIGKYLSIFPSYFTLETESLQFEFNATIRMKKLQSCKSKELEWADFKVFSILPMCYYDQL